MQMQTLCRAVEISITTSYSTSVKMFYRGLSKVFISSPFCDNVHEGQVKRNHFRESLVNHNECRHSIVSYRNSYHWLRENYEFKTTFGTYRIRENESAIASTITWERRQRSASRTKDICVLSSYRGFCGLATSPPFRSEKVISSDEIARASASDGETNRPGKNYWKGLLESLWLLVWTLGSEVRE